MHHYLRTAIATCLVLISSACAHLHDGENTEKLNIQPVENLLPGFYATKYADIYFSGQPPIDQLEKLKAQGFANIVNLRLPTEGGYDASAEKRAAKSVGLNYASAPLESGASLSDKKIDEITKAIVKNRAQGKTLVHCSSRNRVALWVGGHFYKDHGFSRKQAVEFAIDAGLTKPALISVLKDYLNQASEAAF